MTKQDIIDRLTTAEDFGGSWALIKAQMRISQNFGLYEVADYPFDHYEVVRFSLGEADIGSTTLLATYSIQEAIEYYADCVASI